ncbi:Lrp/AsnC ligand binding domain-containing protein [Amycolatopsis sp. La24]|uniref:Lrp/AsnC ligand binding domain-containing protein n=1 Tax=Amycolatopsis sp. La24 TaxID=3028304 RepID=UPI0023B126B3|nr:Lrp/AsnC ligand binding domain-containing protein [Amycolatopsis sp. La24]
MSAIAARAAEGRQLAVGVGLNLSGAAAEVHEQIRAMPAVEFAAATVGRFDLVATVDSHRSNSLLADLERIRALPGVRRATTWLHLDVVKEDYSRKHWGLAE